MNTAHETALLLEDLPQSALAGIDLLSFTATSRFRGVKNIPSGFHFTFVGASTSFSERHGLWFHVPDQPSVTIANWNTHEETLLVECDTAKISRHQATLSQLWKENLTPYRQTATEDERTDGWGHDAIEEWAELTSSITPELLTRILGDAQQWTLSSSSSAARDIEHIPGLDHLNNNDTTISQPEKTLGFLPIDLRQTWRPGATGSERTQAARDRTWAFQNLYTTHTAGHEPFEILGELQFAFLMVLTLNNYSCHQQWRRLLELLLTSPSAVVSHAEFYLRFLQTLRRQFEHVQKAQDAGLFDFALEAGLGHNGLHAQLARFRKGVKEESLRGRDAQRMMDELDEMEEFMHREHGWQVGPPMKGGMVELEDGEEVRPTLGERYLDDDEDDETGEFAPQIVDLTPAQARMLQLDHAGESDGRDVAKMGLEQRLRLEVEADERRHDGIERSSDHHREHLTDGDDDDDGIDEHESQDLDQMDSRY